MITKNKKGANNLFSKEKEKQLTRSGIVFLLAVFCCLLWGSAFPCIKIGYQILQVGADDVSSQILFAGYRFTLAGILTILIGSIGNRRILIPNKESIKKILVLSFFQTIVQYLFFYIGLANTTGVKASIIGGINVFLAILIACLLFHQEKMTIQKTIGCFLGFAGIIIINIGKTGFNGNMKFKGEGFILISTVAYAFSSVFIKKYSKSENPVMLSGYQFMTGGIVLTALGLAGSGKLQFNHINAIVILLYLAILSATAYSIWGILLKYNPVSKVTIYGFANPLFGVILSAFLLHEKNQAFGLKTIVALFFVCTGIFIVNREKQMN